jgi:hypothetical protein
MFTHKYTYPQKVLIRHANTEEHIKNEKNLKISFSNWPVVFWNSKAKEVVAQCFID